jgi:hypothetical protein
MNTHSVSHLLAVAAAASFMLPMAWAQSEATSPPSRADVKAETRAANKARQLQPAGEGPSSDAAAKSAPTKTKAERKAETLQARKEGKLSPAGIAGQLKVEKAIATAPSTRTKAERKAETRDAAKAHQLAPAGEVAEPKK